MVGLMGWGCGRGKPAMDPAMGGMNRAAGMELGELIAAESEASGEIVLVHQSTDPAEVKSWVDGLKSGASGKGTKVVEYGPAQMSEEALGYMGGFYCLREAMDQFPNAVAVVTTVSIGAFERPAFPETHPPVYALNWADVASSLFLFRHEDIRGGVFVKPDYVPEPPTPGASPQELFDQMYVLVTADNVRDVIRRYPNR